MRTRVITTVLMALVLTTAAAVAQDEPSGPPSGAPPQEGRGPGPNRQGVGGEITAIQGTTVTLKTFRGETAQVKISAATKIRKDGKEAKLSDFKVGDRVFAGGEKGSDGTWNAEVFGQRSGGPGGMRDKPEDNGKTYILGKVTAIDGTKVTVTKPDTTVQVIEVDDSTSFRNARHESATLADLKVGDMVRGEGAVQNGVFVPRQLSVGMPPHRMRPDGTPPSGASSGTPSGNSSGAQSSGTQSNDGPPGPPPDAGGDNTNEQSR